MSTWDFTPTRGPETDTSMPRFYIRAVKNEFKSQQAGHDVFEDREYVEIIVPGQKNQIVDRAVKEEDQKRWPGQYAAFKANQEAPLEGWPLAEWAAISASQKAELQSLGIKTVEQLANLPDQFLTKIMGGYALREKARLALEQAKGAEPLMRLQAEKEALQDEMRAMEARFKAQIEELMKAKTDA